LAALEELALPHAGLGVTFGQAVLHRDDLIGKRNLRSICAKQESVEARQ
jgi:hypothetical protein